MNKPKLQSGDIAWLRRYRAIGRRLEQLDYNTVLDWPEYHRQRKELRAELFQIEKAATPAAYYWLTNVSSDTLTEELKRWREEYQWIQTRAGWRAHRFIKGRRVYASKPCQTGVKGAKPVSEFIRL